MGLGEWDGWGLVPGSSRLARPPGGEHKLRPFLYVDFGWGTKGKGGNGNGRGREGDGRGQVSSRLVRPPGWEYKL